MSAKANQQDPLLNQQEQKNQETANQAALANGEQQPPVNDPEGTANDQLGTTGETDAEKIAKAVDAVHKLNPSLTLGEVAKIVASAFSAQESPEAKVAKEVARIIPKVDNEFTEKVYLKKDTKRKFPLEKEALDGIIVRQTYKRKTEEGDDITVPARNLNEIAIYSPEDFKRLSLPGKGFDREGITVEVWHKPGQKDTVQVEETDEVEED